MTAGLQDCRWRLIWWKRDLEIEEVTGDVE